MVVSRQNAVVRDGPVLHLAVTDAGLWIPVQFRERIFEMFFRVEHHRAVDAKNRQGTGIGPYLAITSSPRSGNWCDAGQKCWHELL